MKKISLLSLFIILVVAVLTVSAYASTTGKMELGTDKLEYNKDDKVVVDVRIKDLETDTGIIGLGGKLEYDKNALEFEKIEGVGEWSKPQFNEENGKWITDRGDLTKENETVFKATFKVKSSDAGNTEIKLEDVETSGGEGAFKLDSATKTIAVKKVNNPTNTPSTDPKPSGDQGGTQGGSSTTNTVISLDKNAKKTATENFPKAGLPAPIIVILMSIAIVAGLIFYLKFEKVSRKK